MSRKHEFSLAAKLAALEVGDIVYLPDRGDPSIPTHMERSVQSIATKSPRLAARRFSTMRCDVITVHRKHEVVLRIERVE